MKAQDIINEVRKAPIVVGLYISTKLQKFEAKERGKADRWAERNFVLVDGEPKEYGRWIDKEADANPHKLKPGQEVVVKVQIRPDGKLRNVFRIGGELEPLAA